MRFLLAACARRYATIFLLGLLPSSSLRVMTARLMGCNVGKRCYIGFGFQPDTNYTSLIAIGNYVTISHNVSIATHTGTPVRESSLARMYASRKPVVLCDGCWIGMNTTILPGAYVGPSVFVAAGSVVVGRLDQPGLYAGNPARFKKEHAG